MNLLKLGLEAETRRKEIEEARCLPSDLIAKVKTSGVLRLWTAKKYGGQQASIIDLMEAIQTLSFYNGSLGWVVAVTGTAALGCGYMKQDAAQKIFGHSDAMAGGWAAPAGTAKKVKGGIQVSGKWAWGSGISHCSHIVGGILIKEEGVDRPRSAIAYFNPDEVTFIDNWQVLGLKGTNSINYTVKDAFVPDDYWMYFPVRKPVIDDTLYHFSFLGALASGVASVAIGLAKRALEEIKTLSLTKKPYGAARTLAERPLIHDQFAKMEATYWSAKLFLENAVAKNWTEAQNRKATTTTKSQLRLAATYATLESAKIVQQAYQIGGGSTIWDGVKLQELLRDVNVVTQHGLIAPNNFEIAGRVRFGLKVNEWLL